MRKVREGGEGEWKILRHNLQDFYDEVLICIFYDKIWRNSYYDRHFFLPS